MTFCAKVLLAALSFGILGLPADASAQIYDGAGFSQSQDLSFQTSIKFKIPLGATDHRRVSDQSRLSFGLSLENIDFGSSLTRRDRRYRQEPLNLLDVGAYGFKYPSVQLVGQEIHGSTFNALYADESEGDTDEAKTGSNTTLLVVGGLAVVGLGSTLFLLELEDEVADCLDAINRPGECAD